VNSRKLVFII